MLHRRAEKYRRNHPGEHLAGPFPDLAKRRLMSGMSPGALAVKACIGVRQLLAVEADPTTSLESSLVLRLRLALGMVREDSGSTLDSPATALEQG